MSKLISCHSTRELKRILKDSSYTPYYKNIVSLELNKRRLSKNLHKRTTIMD